MEQVDSEDCGEMSETKYKGWKIWYHPPPIPDRRFDWSAVHEDYDGDGDDRCFSAGSVEEAMCEIDEREEEI